MTDSVLETKNSPQGAQKYGSHRHSRKDTDEKDSFDQDRTSKGDDRGHRHHHSRHKQNRKEEEQDKSTTTVVQPCTDLQPFFEDRKGDGQNLVYGGLHRAAVPRYHKFGYGGLVGLDRRFRISQDTSNPSIEERGLDPARRNRGPSLLTFKDTNIPPSRIIPRGMSEEGFLHQQSYIAFCSEPWKRSKRAKREGQADQAKRESSRSAQSDITTDSSTDEATEDAFEVFRNDSSQLKMVELKRATADRPLDVEAWLALIVHQDLMVVSKNGTQPITLSNNDKSVLAESKLALYERALSKIKDDEGRERLIVGLMDEGAKVWDTRKLQNQWESILKVSPYPGLWIRYLNFQQSNFITFRFDQCLLVYRQCLRSTLSQQPSFTRDENSIYILLRLTIFMAQAGYMERATSIWQAVLELTFFAPKHLDSTAQNASFETFWESEAVRIGEEGATGWETSSQKDVAPKADEGFRTTPTHLYEKWIACELKRAEASKLAARTLDDVFADDPFRVILFSDISDFLLRPTSESGHFLLINAFLQFCNMPPLYEPGNNSHHKWWTDPYLRRQELTRSDPILKSTHVLPCPNLVSETAILFSQDKDPSSPWPTLSSSEQPIPSSWRKRTMRLLVDKLSQDEVLAEYVVAWEARLDLQQSRKYAKSLLKKRKSSLRLYNAYALIECQLGNFEAAEHVWSTAILMNSTSVHPDRSGASLLWRSWVWHSLARGHTAKTERLLLSLPDGLFNIHGSDGASSSNSTAKLRAQNYMRSQLSHHVSLKQHNPVLHFCELLAIYNYLNTDRSLDIALGEYTLILKALGDDGNTSLLKEALHQSRARLLHIHMTSSPHIYRPLDVSHNLRESVREFPNNTLLLQIRHSIHTGLPDRIRESVEDAEQRYTGNQQDRASFMAAIFQIFVEISRPSYAGSTVHSIRATFERTLTTDSPWSSSVLIWRWYIIWETQVLSEETSSAKGIKMGEKIHGDLKMKSNKAVEVYYRGIRSCPWAKGLYLLAFSEEKLRQCMGNEPLRKIYDTMVEKGFRVHVSLDDLEDHMAT